MAMAVGHRGEVIATAATSAVAATCEPAWWEPSQLTSNNITNWLNTNDMENLITKQ